MPDAHDGPISQGIRDAIRASNKTPYAIAKQVTLRGKVKLTGPQIYRFIKGDKGLSLAVLDEIARVLDLKVSHASMIVPPLTESRFTTVNGIILTGDEPLEDILYIFQYDHAKVNEYLAGLRRSRPYERKPPDLETTRRRQAARARRVARESGVNLGVCRTSSPSDSSDEVADKSDDELEGDVLKDHDEDSSNPQEPVSSFQAKLDSLGMPDGFEEGETSWEPKFKRLEARYRALLSEIGSSPLHKRLLDARFEQERDRIIKESQDTPEHEWIG